MAAVPALLNFAFDSTNTSGCYRIATRIQGSGDPYVITAAACTPFVAPTLSVPCTAQIGITVDDETCDDVIYEGYIQPCCQEEASLDGRVPFTVTFTPNPTCKSYLLTCDSSGVSLVNVDTPGSGYTPGATVAVVIADPAGTLAAADCKVEDDGVEAFTTNLPQAAVIANGVYDEVLGVNLVVAGTPTPGYFDITVVSNVITSVVVTPPTNGNPVTTGEGYTVGDTITFAAPFNALVLTVTDIYDNGEVLVCVVTAAGSGYTGPTTATLPAVGPEVAPVLSVVNTLCDPIEYFGTGCDDDVTPLRPDVALGATVQICRKGDVGTPPANMSIVEGGCCADPGCETWTITALPGYEGNFWYVDCCSTITESPTTKSGLVPADGPQVINAMIGSLVYYPPGSEALLTIVGPTPYVCP